MLIDTDQDLTAAPLTQPADVQLVRGRVEDAQGNPISGIQFMITRGSGENAPRTDAMTDENGNFYAFMPANLSGAGWSVHADLPGFRKVAEVKRQFGDARSVGQVVYSDGMAAVFVFIEPMAGRDENLRTGPSSLGAFQIYTRAVANHVADGGGRCAGGQRA